MSAALPALRFAEVAAITSIGAPLLGWAAALAPIDAASAAASLAMLAFPALGRIGLSAHVVAVGGLLRAPVASGSWAGAGRAVALTVLGPMSWLVCWLVALIAWTIDLQQPGATDEVFDVFGGA